MSSRAQLNRSQSHMLVKSSRLQLQSEANPDCPQVKLIGEVSFTCNVTFACFLFSVFNGAADWMEPTLKPTGRVDILKA